MLVFYLAAIDNDESKNKFEYIYHKYYRFMLRTASSIIRDSSLAEDAVHETFVQLLKEIDSLSERLTFFENGSDDEVF